MAEPTPLKSRQQAQPAESQPQERAFTADIQEIQRRAREAILCGAVTPSYEGDVEKAIDILNQALATEIVCTLRYRNHYFMAEGIDSKQVAEEFLEHANEEQEHADMIATRIRQLNGTPEMNPAGLTSRSHAQYSSPDTLVDMLKENLIAERIAIDTYREMIRYFGEHDPTSRRMMEEILAKEEEHAEELQSLLSTLDPTKRAAS